MVSSLLTLFILPNVVFGICKIVGPIEVESYHINMNCSNLTIDVTQATYGSNCMGLEDSFNNVFNLVVEKCRNKSICNFIADDDQLGDPVPGCPKTFQYCFNCYGNDNIHYDSNWWNMPTNSPISFTPKYDVVVHNYDSVAISLQGILEYQPLDEPMGQQNYTIGWIPHTIAHPRVDEIFVIPNPLGVICTIVITSQGVIYLVSWSVPVSFYNTGVLGNINIDTKSKGYYYIDEGNSLCGDRVCDNSSDFKYSFNDIKMVSLYGITYISSSYTIRATSANKGLDNAENTSQIERILYEILKACIIIAIAYGITIATVFYCYKKQNKNDKIYDSTKLVTTLDQNENDNDFF